MNAVLRSKKENLLDQSQDNMSCLPASITSIFTWPIPEDIGYSSIEY